MRIDSGTGSAAARPTSSIERRWPYVCQGATSSSSGMISRIWLTRFSASRLIPGSVAFSLSDWAVFIIRSMRARFRTGGDSVE